MFFYDRKNAVHTVSNIVSKGRSLSPASVWTTAQEAHAAAQPYIRNGLRVKVKYHTDSGAWIVYKE